MPVSQRLRFEILRRDRHKCRYCGVSAWRAPLTIDHVMPAVLGGSDAPDNLVAACGPCNQGKASVLLGGPTVASPPPGVLAEACGAMPNDEWGAGAAGIVNLWGVWTGDPWSTAYPDEEFLRHITAAYVAGYTYSAVREACVVAREVRDLKISAYLMDIPQAFRHVEEAEALGGN